MARSCTSDLREIGPRLHQVRSYTRLGSRQYHGARSLDLALCLRAPARPCVPAADRVEIGSTSIPMALPPCARVCACAYCGRLLVRSTLCRHCAGWRSAPFEVSRASTHACAYCSEKARARCFNRRNPRIPHACIRARSCLRPGPISAVFNGCPNTLSTFPPACTHARTGHRAVFRGLFIVRALTRTQAMAAIQDCVISQARTSSGVFPSATIAKASDRRRRRIAAKCIWDSTWAVWLMSLRRSSGRRFFMVESFRLRFASSRLGNQHFSALCWHCADERFPKLGTDTELMEPSTPDPPRPDVVKRQSGLGVVPRFPPLRREPILGTDGSSSFGLIQKLRSGAGERENRASLGTVGGTIRDVPADFQVVDSRQN